MLERRVGGVQLLDLILGEVADLHLARRRHAALHRGELCGEQAGERGLAVAVAAKQRNPVVGIEPEVEPLENRHVRIAHRRHVQRDQRRPQLGRIGEAEGERRILRHRRDRLHLGEHLGAALRLLGGRGAGGVPRDIILQLSPLRILVRPCRGELRHPLRALLLERVVAAGIERDLAALEMQDVIDDVVQEIALMADHDDRGRDRS